jgi:hypothetical protein
MSFKDEQSLSPSTYQALSPMKENEISFNSEISKEEENFKQDPLKSMESMDHQFSRFNVFDLE